MKEGGWSLVKSIYRSQPACGRFMGPFLLLLLTSFVVVEKHGWMARPLLNRIGGALLFSEKHAPGDTETMTTKLNQC